VNTRKQTASEGLLIVARAILLLVPLLLATPSRASAYADPGTGAFMYQAAYAAFLGGSFYLRKLLDRFWPKAKKDISRAAPVEMGASPKSL
jgi:hypothetical protein